MPIVILRRVSARVRVRVVGTPCLGVRVRVRVSVAEDSFAHTEGQTVGVAVRVSSPRRHLLRLPPPHNPDDHQRGAGDPLAPLPDDLHVERQAVLEQRTKMIPKRICPVLCPQPHSAPMSAFCREGPTESGVNAAR